MASALLRAARRIRHGPVPCRFKPWSASSSESQYILESVRSLSGSDNATSTAAKEDDVEVSKFKHKQSFVTTEIEPQEWDHAKTDPLHRPKYKSRAQILSKHDYARQPSVSFEDQYDNFADAMITLSWMDRATQRKIYVQYINWMVAAHEKFGKTSHEYVCRLLAQKHHITPQRAAAIIQLQHNEQQLKIQNAELFQEDAELMDAYMKNTIEQAYRSTGETPPESFLESPDAEGGMESEQTMIVEDIMDMDLLVRDANVREQQRAKLMINEHIYKEDVDDETIGININEATKLCIVQKEKLKAAAVPDPIPSPTALAAEQKLKEKRPRWQFAAQIVDTTELHPRSKYAKYKKLGKKIPQTSFGRKHRMGFLNNFVDNVVIEKDGDLRIANLAEVKKMSWKPTRVDLEHTYANVQKAWLDRTVRGKRSAWGMAPEPPGQDKKAIVNAADDGTLEAADEDVNAELTSSSDSDGPSSSSDSDGSSSDSDRSSSDSDAEPGSLHASSPAANGSNLDGASGTGEPQDEAESPATEDTPNTTSAEETAEKQETKEEETKDDK
jgi:hypothetical protein